MADRPARPPDHAERAERAEPSADAGVDAAVRAEIAMREADAEDEQQEKRTEYAALNWAAVLACVVLLWLISPIGIGILLGTFLAFMAQPLFRSLTPRIGERGAAGVTVGLSMLGFTAALGGIAWLFFTRGTVLAGQIGAAFAPGGTGDDAIAQIARVTGELGMSRPELEAHAKDLAAEVSNRAADIAAAIASTTGSAMLALFFAMLSMHYILRNWDLISRRAVETFPLRPEYTAALFAEFRQVGRTTLLGALGTAVAQGVFATIGYAIAGVPEPALFGAATALASFVPAVGVLLVILPVGAGLFAFGYPGHAIVALVWGLVFVVGVCDYVVRPRLVAGEGKVPTLVTFAAIFGGVEVFGLKGLIAGPVLMALAIAVLRLYADETRKRRHIPVT